jgi:hypothetical protein
VKKISAVSLASATASSNMYVHIGESGGCRGNGGFSP